jgi:hypothetical protein
MAASRDQLISKVVDPGANRGIVDLVADAQFEPAQERFVHV